MAKVILNNTQPDLSHRSRDVVQVASRIERHAVLTAPETRGPVAESIHKAGRDMRKQQAAGAVSMEGPTPERAALANGAMRLGQDGTYRVEDSQLAKLFTRGALGRQPSGSDPSQNRVLYEAGERYYSHTYHSGLIESGTLDPSRIVVDGGRAGMPGYGMPLSERAAHHRGWLRRFERKLGPVHSVVLKCLIINDEPVAEIGRRLSGYQDEDCARAIGLFLAIGALKIIAVECSLMDS